MPKGESSCENSPLTFRISKIWCSGPDHNFVISASLRTYGQNPHILGPPLFHVVKAFSLPVVFSRLKWVSLPIP
jgi:hypothetical protein